MAQHQTGELDGSQIMQHLEGHVEDLEFYFDSNEQPLKELKRRSGAIIFHEFVCSILHGGKSKSEASNKWAIAVLQAEGDEWLVC